MADALCKKDTTNDAKCLSINTLVLSSMREISDSYQGDNEAGSKITHYSSIHSHNQLHLQGWITQI